MGHELTGKVAVVTGASSGLGRGIAVGFARAGAKVVIGDLVETSAPGGFDERPELTTAELIASFGGEAAFQPCDVSKVVQVSRLVETAVERFGHLDIFVNNAGVYRGGAFLEQSEADLDACLDVIVKGTWFGAQAAIQRFLAQGGGGNLINIVSTAGLRGHVGQAAYNTAKGAQAMLTRSLALEYAAHALRVNGVCPTYMRTAMSRSGVESPFSDYVRRVVPLGRWGEISDVVELTLFLASDASSFIHGALIPLDGGETLGVAPRADG